MASHNSSPSKTVERHPAGKASNEFGDSIAPPAAPVSAVCQGSWRGLRRLVLFFCFVAASAYLIDAIIDSGLRRIQTSKFGSLNRVIAGRVNADIIINGSSRALTHYDPRIIQEKTGRSAYNLGLNGVQIDVQLAMLKTYLKHNTKPKLVIQNLDSFSFEATRPGEIYDPALYIPYLGEPEIYRGLHAIDPAVRKWKYIPLYGYAVEDMRFTWALGVAAWSGHSKREDYYLGFNPRHLHWTEDFDRFRASIGNGVRYRIDQKGVNALREILGTCKGAGIPVVLVYSPEYFEMQVLELNRTDIFATFEILRAEFDVVLWDYSESVLSHHRDFFYNSQHLNATGAKAFSIQLGKRLLETAIERKGL